jgi:subtilisin family serine protease
MRPRSPLPRLLPILCAVATLALTPMAFAPAAWAQAAVGATPPAAAAKPRIEKAADLPRFSYPVSGKVEDIVRSAERFAPFAAAVRRDVESVLAGYEIPDHATERDLLTLLALLDFLDGRYDAALSRADAIRALEDKPADQLLSGLRLRVMAQAAKSSGGPTAPGYPQAVADGLMAALKPMPFAVIANDVRELKAGAEVGGEGRVIGRLREVVQPIADRSGALSSDFAQMMIGARYTLVATLPLKATFVDAFTRYLADNKVTKADIWAARDVALPPDNRKFSPVRVAVWDSGVDVSLFGPQLLKDAQGRPVSIAYDKFSRPSSSLLAPLTPAVQAKLPEMAAQTKGFSDLQSDIDSPESSAIKQFLSNLAPADYKTAIEEIGMVGNYEHGTHVAGIALAGNPYARLVVARLEFDYHLQPEPCPSKAQTLADAVAAKKTVAFLKAQKVRVVNMSWGGDVQSIEGALEQCGLGKTPEARKATARELFDIQKRALTEAFASAPEILFIAAAGNSNNDPAFVEDVPAAIVLPNMLTVGAVDLAGDEAGFTSYGKMVQVHANGYQVESFLPGGKRVALSGTSMAAPQVANLAAKLLAVNPKLTPVALAKLIVDTGDRSADGRRNLMNPKKALAAAEGG